MSQHDLRQQTRQIREALQRYDRDQLIDILTHVFGQYVVEGSLETAPPAPAGLGEADLGGLSFAQVIERLQLRLGLPELQLFEVQGGRVSVRVEGRLVPLSVEAPRAEPRIAAVAVSLQPQPASPAPPVAAQAPAPPPASGALPGVRPAGHAGNLVGGVVDPSAPPPPPVISRSGEGPRGTPGSVPLSSINTAPPPRVPGRDPSPPPAPAQPAAPAPSKAPPKDDQGEGRFGLLEID